MTTQQSIPKFEPGQRVTKCGENQEGRIQGVTYALDTFRYNVKWDTGPTTLHGEADLRPAQLPPHYP